MFEDFRRAVTVFLASQMYAWRSAMMYRTQFILYSVYAALEPFFFYITISIIYSISNGIAGWSYYQLLLLAGISNILYFAYTYFFSYSTLSDDLRWGKIDPYLTKPYSPFTMMTAQYPNNYQLGGVLGGIALFIYAASNLQLGIPQLLIFMVLLVLGVIMLAMLMLMFTLITYNFFGNGDYIDWLTGVFSDVSKNPLTVYGIGGAFLLTFILPLGVAAYYPAQALLGRIDPTTVAIVALVAIAFTLLSRKLAYFALKHYASGGG